MADVGMKDVAQIEQYARDLEQIAHQVDDNFSRLKHKTDDIGMNWSDSQFSQFHQMFNDIIMKQTKGITDTLRKLSIYTKKQCEYHRQAMQEKLYQ